MNCFFTASSRTVSSITATADSFNALTVKNIITLLKFVKIFRNTEFILLLNIIIIITYLKTVSQHTAVSTAILNMQSNSLNAESVKNS